VHWIRQTEVLLPPPVEGLDGSEVAVSIARVAKLQQEPLDVLPSGLVCIDLLEEPTQFRFVELEGSR
jgi:hypothetical protein